MGLPLHPLTLEQAALSIEGSVARGEGIRHIALNAAKISAIRRDPELAAAVQRAHLVTADGQGVVWGAFLLGNPVPERVAGIDLMDRLVRGAAVSGASVYFLGARHEVVADVVALYQTRHPSLRVAGFRDGYFSVEAEAEVARSIAAASADLLFCALPTPRKELFLDRWADTAGVRFAMGVGGAFDVVTGRIPRAPLWLQKAGLEWLYRFGQEPRRLWRRTLWDHTAFLVHLGTALLHHATPGEGP